VPFLSWGEKYRVGVDCIDQEHQYLFDLINEFHDLHLHRAQRHALARVLNRLVQYAEEHFRHEEAIMEKAGYPAYTAHCGLHEQLYLTIYRLSDELAAGSLRADMDTVRFIRSWLVNHIAQHDLQFAGYLAGRAQSPPANDGETPAVPETK